MRKDNRESESGDDDERGQEATCVYWATRVLVRRELIRAAMREERIWKWSKNEC